ncbi:MAG TPA: tannase/feruloyl esterase family alpha/beta hydrolase [Vicinamibacterales bacterium]
MKRRIVIGTLFAWILAGAAPRGSDVAGADRAAGLDGLLQSGHAECSHLMMLKLPDVKVTEAVAVPAATTGAVRAAHCRVNGVIGTEIKFSLLLPDQWNGKFFMGGGGGFVGNVQNSAISTVNAGFATVGTDTGHQGGITDASWALNNLERKVNFGYLAIHRTAATAKAIVAAYYGSSATKNYFAGCSRGGGQAFMEAQRFPEDFDGIVAGAPAFNWTALAAQMLRNMQAAFPDPTSMTPMFTSAELKTVESKIIEACDAADGVKDGVMEDPRRCKFNLDSLPLSAKQLSTLKSIYGPIVVGEDQIYPGQPFGGEGENAGWPLWITGGATTVPGGPSLRFAFGTGIFRYLVFNDPTWAYNKYDLANWKKDTVLAASYLNATDPNLDAFKAHGGKMILWHGWSDPALTPLASIQYHEQVYARDSLASDYFRTFLLPGVLHCDGGPGPDNVDWPSLISAWVENGQAPQRVIARKMANGAATRSRPLCPYPQKAEYKGAGSTDDEANFVCK